MNKSYGCQNYNNIQINKNHKIKKDWYSFKIYTGKIKSKVLRTRIHSELNYLKNSSYDDYILPIKSKKYKVWWDATLDNGKIYSFMN